MKRFIPTFSQIRNVVLLSALLAVGVVYFVPFNGGALGAVTAQECSLGRFIDHTYKSGATVPPDSAGGNTGSTISQTTFAVPNQTTNLIQNPSMEQGSGNQPMSWLSNVYGKNDAAFSVSSDAHTGKYSLSVQIKTFSDGDADWYYLPVPVNGGGYYQYDDFYKSNVATPVILEAVDGAGNTTYINLTGAAASPSWNHYSIRFFVPAGSVKATVFHAITNKGYLTVDDASIAPAPLRGFSSGMVSLTFDDGWLSTYTNAFPQLQREGLVSTQYLISGYLNAPQYMSVADALKMKKAGNEIASHTLNHLDLTSQTPAAATNELSKSKHDLSNCLGAVTDFAPPYGTYNQATSAEAAKLYASQRSTEAGFNTADSFNPYDIKVQNITNSTTQDQLQGWLRTAKANNLWLVLVYHQVDETGSQYSRSLPDFENDLQTIKQSDLPVLTVNQALSNINSQTIK